MYIHAAEHFIVGIHAERKEINTALRVYTAEQPRPANRSTLIALVGAMKCVQHQKVKGDTDVYMATEFGNIENTLKCLNDVYVTKELPMPFTFLNTLNNMTGFHIAKILQLTSKNMTISSKGVSFEKALQLVRASLLNTQAASALVGGTDSAFKEFYVGTPGMLPEETVLKEGSAWLYINNDPAEAIGRIKEVKSFSELSALAEWLHRYAPGSQTSIAYNVHLSGSEKSMLGQARPECKLYDYVKELGYFGTVAAAGVVQFLKENTQRTLLHISKDRFQTYTLIELERF